MSGRRRGHREPADLVGAQHLVLDLDLVEGQEEGSAAIEESSLHQVGLRVKEPGRFESLATGCRTEPVHAGSIAKTNRRCPSLDTASGSRDPSQPPKMLHFNDDSIVESADLRHTYLDAAAFITRLRQPPRASRRAVGSAVPEGCSFLGIERDADCVLDIAVHHVREVAGADAEVA